MRSLRCLLVLLMLSGAALGEEARSQAQAIADRMRDIVFVSGEFQQRRTLAALPAPLVSHGTFSYRRGDEIRWRTESPVASELQIRPEGLTVVDAQGARDGDADALSGLLYSLFAADLERLSTLFTIEAAGSTEQWTMQLQPRHQRLAQHLEQITMRGGRFTEAVTIELANGDRTAIKISVAEVKPADD